MYNISLLLTFFRLFASLFLLPFLLFFLLGHNSFFCNSSALVLFLALSLTDLLDGYLARKLGKITVLGAVFDAIADKCLLTSTMVVLVAFQRLNFYWPILFIGREFMVTGLRLIALEYGFSIKVLTGGKLKTVLITIVLCSLLFNSDWYCAVYLNILLLTIACLVSYYSAWSYYCVFRDTYNKKRSYY